MLEQHESAFLRWIHRKKETFMMVHHESAFLAWG
jgi:hypothetical protein